MALVDGVVGISENTALKQQHYRLIMERLALIHRRGLAKPQNQQWVLPELVHVELNPGPGYLEELALPGSPVIAAEAYGAEGLPVVMHCPERERKVYPKLLDNLQRWGRLRLLDEDWRQARLVSATRQLTCYAYPRDYALELPRLLAEERERKTREGLEGHNVRQSLGVLYSDESGCMPPLSLLQSCAVWSHWWRLDVLIHVATTNLKRRRASPVDPWPYTLEEVMAMIGKPYWIVREPFGPHGWSFVMGTHWERFPEFRAQGFYRLDSLEGCEILRRLNEVIHPKE